LAFVDKRTAFPDRVSVVLARLLRLILLSAYMPQGFKISYIVPIPKPKEFMSKSLSYDDFRSIAISPIISKIFEYCFLDKFESLLSSSDNQFGFSCRSAIYTFRKVVDSYVTRGTTANICTIDLSIRLSIKLTTMPYLSN